MASKRQPRPRSKAKAKKPRKPSRALQAVSDSIRDAARLVAENVAGRAVTHLYTTDQVVRSSIKAPVRESLPGTVLDVSDASAPVRGLTVYPTTWIRVSLDWTTLPFHMRSPLDISKPDAPKARTKWYRSGLDRALQFARENIYRDVNKYLQCLSVAEAATFLLEDNIVEEFEENRAENALNAIEELRGRAEEALVVAERLRPRQRKVLEEEIALMERFLDGQDEEFPVETVTIDLYWSKTGNRPR